MPAGMNYGQTDRRALDVDRQVVGTTLDEVYNNPWIEIRSLRLANGAALNGISNISPYIAFPNAGFPLASFGILTRPAWTNGTFTLRLVWSGDTASANTASWNFDYSTVDLGGVPGSTTGPVTTAAGPGTINALQDYTIAFAGALNATHIYVGVGLYRDAAADAYAGETRLFGLQFRFTPSPVH